MPASFIKAGERCQSFFERCTLGALFGRIKRYETCATTVSRTRIPQMRSFLAASAAVVVLLAETPAPHRIAITRVFPQPDQISLFIAASDGSGEQPLLSSHDADYDPVWSPDGKKIVFTSDRGGSADLFQVNPDGSGVTQLTNDPAYDDQAAFSPDGKRLVFVSTRSGGRAHLWTLDLATRRATALTSGQNGDFRPSWSPDGKWIAFSSDRGNPAPFAHGRWERLQLADIYVVHPDGSGLRKLTKGDFCGSPKWTSDSSRLVAYCMTAEQTLMNRLPHPYTGNDTRLVSIDPSSGASTDLPAGPGVKFHPTPLAEREIGYIRKDTDDAGIYYTSGRRGPHGDIRSASWSPDGARVVFERRQNVPRGSAIHKTFSRNAKYELSLIGLLAAFSPSGKEYVTNSAPSTNVRGAALSVTSVESGASRVLYQDKNRNILAGAWAPKGDRIVFGIGGFAAFFDGFHSQFLKPADRVEDGAQVAIVNADGTGFQELTKGTGNSAFPSFSPDGNRFVYRTFEKDGYGLRIMNLETKAVTPLTKEYDNFPLWSPRGDLILFCRLVDGAYEVFTIKPDGSALKRLTFTKGNDAHMGWSPDGQYIVFASSRMGFKDEVIYTDAPQPYGEIFVMRYDGTGVEQLTDNQWEEGTPSWQR